jgi:hypothetical protein
MKDVIGHHNRVCNSKNHTRYCEYGVLGNILDFNKILVNGDLGELGDGRNI